MKTSRRNFLFSALAGGCAVATYARLYESTWLESNETEVRLGNDSEFEAIRILHLSDLHWSSYVSLEFLVEAFELGIACAPDLICLTGDFISVGNEYQLGEYLPLLKLLANSAPTFACLGNHDGGRWSAGHGGFADESVMADLLTQAGITVLHNSSVALQVRSRGFNLVGLPDLWSGDINPGEAFSEIKSGGTRKNVVIAHNPDSKERISQFDWDLMLCGHTHGGQIAIPLVGAPYAPIRDRRYIAGLNRWNGRQIFTTRGVGSLYGVRFYCRPEVSVLKIT